MGSGHICLFNTDFYIPILFAHHKPLWPHPPRCHSGELLGLCVAQLVAQVWSLSSPPSMAILNSPKPETAALFLLRYSALVNFLKY